MLGSSHAPWWHQHGGLGFQRADHCLEHSRVGIPGEANMESKKHRIDMDRWISLATAIACVEDGRRRHMKTWYMKLRVNSSWNCVPCILTLTSSYFCLWPAWHTRKSHQCQNIVWPPSSSSYHDIMGAKCYLLSNCTPLKLGADSSNQILLLCRPTPNLGFPDFSWSFLVTASIMGLDVGRLDTIHYINGREN